LFLVVVSIVCLAVVHLDWSWTKV